MKTRLLLAGDGCPDAYELRAALEALGQEVESFEVEAVEDLDVLAVGAPGRLDVLVVSRYLVWQLEETLQDAVARCGPGTLVVESDHSETHLPRARSYDSSRALLNLLLGHLGGDPQEPDQICSAVNPHLTPRFHPVIWSPPHLYTIDDRCLELHIEIAEARAHLAAGTLEAFLAAEVAVVDENAL